MQAVKMTVVSVRIVWRRRNRGCLRFDAFNEPWEIWSNDTWVCTQLFRSNPCRRRRPLLKLGGSASRAGRTVDAEQPRAR